MEGVSSASKAVRGEAVPLSFPTSFWGTSSGRTLCSFSVTWQTAFIYYNFISGWWEDDCSLAFILQVTGKKKSQMLTSQAYKDGHESLGQDQELKTGMVRLAHGHKQGKRDARNEGLYIETLPLFWWVRHCLHDIPSILPKILADIL